MKLVWISPTHEDVSTPDRLRQAGHAVVGYGPHDWQVPFPVIEKVRLTQFCQAADVVILAGPHTLEATRSSWKPSKQSLFFDELRRVHALVALGPTPTVDLLVGDARYLRKWCGRLGLPYDARAQGEAWSSGAWFKKRAIIPDGPYLRPWAPIFKNVGFIGWFELLGVLVPTGPVVTGASASWDPETLPPGREAEFLVEMAA